MNIYGLSIRQPWASAIVDGPKRIENRTWKRNHAGFYIAIHAGKSFEADAHCDIAIARLWDDMPREKVDFTLGAIIGIARVARFVRFVPSEGHYAYKLYQDDAHRPWMAGPWCWVLEDVIALDEPIPMKGQLGLFGLDEPVVETLRQAWRAARRAA